MRNWPHDAQDNQVPNTDLETRGSIGNNNGLEVLHDSMSSTRSDDVTTVECLTEPGTSRRDQRQRPSKPKLRGIKSWSIEEKEEIMYCYHYGKKSSKKVQRGTNIVLEKLKERKVIDEAKLEETSIANIRSLVSQIKKRNTIPWEQIAKINEMAEKDAAKEATQIERKDTSLTSWSKQKRYDLLWCYYYGQHQGKNAQEKNTIFIEKFCNMYPEMTGQPRKVFASARTNTQNHSAFRNILQKIKMESTGEADEDIEEAPYEKESNIIELRGTVEVEAERQTYAEAVVAHSPPPINEPVEETTPAGNLTEDRQTNSEARQPVQRSPPIYAEIEEPENGIQPRIQPTQGDNIQLNQDQIALKETLLDMMEEERYRDVKEREKLPKIPLSKTLKALIGDMNRIIETIEQEGMDITATNRLQYCAAKLVSDKIAPQKPRHQNKRRQKQHQPAWKKRLTNQINNLRAEVSILEEYKNGIRTAKVMKKAKKIIDKHAIKNDEELRFIIQNNKLQIQADAKKLRDLQKKDKRKKQNKLFRENPKQLYRELSQSDIKVERTPDPVEVMAFWSNIYENQKPHNKEADWLRQQKEEAQNQEKMEWVELEVKDIEGKLSPAANWKAPGPDRIPNFWLKRLTATHHQLTRNINEIINDPEKTPDWMLEGYTTLLPKHKDTWIVNNYRPITCLSTTYKLITGLISDQIKQHTEIADEQKGGKKYSYGTKDQLLLNKAILESCRKGKKNLATAWIDYKKAYDSIPHSWIIDSLRLHGVSENIIRFMEMTMKKWKTTLALNHENGTINVGPLNILNGIFQGDSLSPLLFIIAMNPLSKELNKLNVGYEMKRSPTEKTKVGHLFFVDDLKLFSPTTEGLTKQLNLVKQFSDDINMTFGLDKCAKAEFKKGKLIKTDNITLEDGKCVIKDIDNHDGVYKYLGIDEGETIKHKEMREKLRKEYIRRTKMVLKTELTTANKIKAINQLAIPVVSYSFGVIDWYQKDLNALDTKTRKLLHSHKCIYKNQCIPRVYIPRNEGGMGLIEMDYTHRSTLVGLHTYINKKQDGYSQAIKYHEDCKPAGVSLTRLARTFRRQMDMEQEIGDTDPNREATILARREKGEYKKRFLKEKHEKWMQHKYSGRYKTELLEKPFVDLKETHGWLIRGDLQPEDERIIMAAQDKGLRTRWFTACIEKSQDDPNCRFCGAELETPTHLVSACEVLLAEGLYTNRHNSVARLIHHKLCKEYGIPTCEHHWQHEPEAIMENEKIKITWDASIPTATYIAHNRPDIILLDKEKSISYIIEIGVPNDYNVLRTERQKVMKYTQLATEIKDLWKCKDAEIIPVVLGATGLIKKSLQPNLDRMPTKVKVCELQREAIKGSCIVFKRALAANLRNG